MQQIRRTLPLGLLLLAGCISLSLPAHAKDPIANPVKSNPAGGPPIDIVFAIDCSGSMGGVIETAKQKVWDIVNEVAKAKPVPHLRIGLFGYGNADASYRKFDLSDDLDTVYGNLLTFKDEGWGDEYVGLAVDKVQGQLSWSKPGSDGASLRVIYVVGNETAQQGPMDYEKAAKKALNADIFVNAIYCGNAGGQDTWQKMASAGGGKYLEIAGDGGSVLIDTPYDKKMLELNGKLNKTYIAYGARREAAPAAQAANDARSMAVGGGASSASRVAAKASNQYRNSDWDLVDAVKDKNVDLSKLKEEELPEDMKKLTPEQRKAKVDQAAKERAAVQKEIQDVDKQRQAYIQEEMKKRGKTNSLDEAVRGLVRLQAGNRGFKFENTSVIPQK